MDYIKIIQIIVQVSIIICFLYFMKVATKYKQIYMECKEKVMCYEGILTGQVCDKYETAVWNISPSLITNLTTTTQHQ